MTINQVFTRWSLLLAWSLSLAMPGGASGQEPGAPAKGAKDILPSPPPKQYEEPRAAALLAKASEFIRVGEARDNFKVTGDGMTVAVLDTGLRKTHKDFTGRVPAQLNFATENEGRADDATDLDGHGTHVAGIVAAGGDHTGMAPKARVIPLKVLGKNGGSWDELEKALQWVLDNHEKHRISVVNMSLGDSSNWQDDRDIAPGTARARVRDRIRELRAKRVAVVVAAGNSYFKAESKQGMAFPAICREVISVGAVFDGDWGKQAYHDGAEAYRTGRDQLTPFSQRLLPTDLGYRTTVFAPGAPILSSGIMTDRGESLSGTSQACPVVAGVVLLMQQYYRRESPHRQLPSVDDLEAWLRSSSVAITDPPQTKDKKTGKLGEYDNVKHTDGRFLRLDAMDALATVDRAVQGEIRQQTTKSASEDPELLELRKRVQKLLSEK